MDSNFYLNKFQEATNQLNKKNLHEKQIEVAVGVVLHAVFLKLYKKTWTNFTQDALNAESRIFFSIWINDSAIEEQRVYYNIHALKLRQLPGYSIQFTG